jgi:hypothetical protein
VNINKPIEGMDPLPISSANSSQNNSKYLSNHWANNLNLG